MNLSHFSQLEYKVDLLIGTIKKLEDDNLSLRSKVKVLNKSNGVLKKKNQDITNKVQDIIKNLRESKNV